MAECNKSNMMTPKNIDKEVMTVIHDAIFDYLVFEVFKPLSKPDFGKIHAPSFILTILNFYLPKTESKSDNFNTFQANTPFLYCFFSFSFLFSGGKKKEHWPEMG